MSKIALVTGAGSGIGQGCATALLNDGWTVVFVGRNADKLNAAIAAAGGPLALVKNGDMITLDVPKRSLHLHVDDAELARRRTAWTPPTPPLSSGYWKLYIDHVLQADEGCDLDFLRGQRGAFVPKDNH